MGLVRLEPDDRTDEQVRKDHKWCMFVLFGTGFMFTVVPFILWIIYCIKNDMVSQ